MEKYNKLVSLHPVILYKENLFTLEEILKKGFSLKDDDLEITFGIEDVELTETSFVKLFSHPLPKHTDVLSVVASNRQDGNNNYMKIDLNNALPHYYISSDDDNWFYGMKTKIDRYFSKLKPWYSFLRTSFSTVVSILIVFSVAGLIFGIVGGSIWLIILSSILLISGIGIGILGVNHSIFPQTRIFLTSKPSNKISIELIIAIVELIIVIATLIITIVPLLQ